MATNFNNLSLGARTTNDFTFGLGDLLGNMGYGDGAPSMLTPNVGGAPGIAAASQGGMWNSLFSRNSLFGGADPATGALSSGWVSPIASLGSAIFGGIQGGKQLKLAESQFKENRRQFDANFAAQRQTINTQLEDRQRARVASNPGAYESVDSYIKRNAV